MTGQIIFKFGGLFPNNIAMDAGFKLAKMTGSEVRAFYLEDYDLIRATRLPCTYEMRRTGAKRCLEIHELRRELKIANRLIKKEIMRRSEREKMQVVFEFLRDFKPQEFGSKCNGAELIVLGERRTSRLMWQEAMHVLECAPSKKVLVAGRNARISDGPVVATIGSLGEWSRLSPMFEALIGNSQSTPIIYTVGSSMAEAGALLSDIEALVDGRDIELMAALNNNQARFLHHIEHLKAGVLLLSTKGPFIREKHEIECLINLLSCPLLISE